MNMSSLAAVATLSLAAAGASWASEPNNTTTPVAAAQAAAPSGRNDPNQTVCKHQDSTGTRLGGVRVCKSRQEWADIAAAARDATENNQAFGAPPPERRH